MAATKYRHARMSEELWEPAQEIIEMNGETMTDVMKHAVREVSFIEECKKANRELAPEPPNGRRWYHYRFTTVIEVLTMSDTKAVERMAAGWDLWPEEWGMKKWGPE